MIDYKNLAVAEIVLKQPKAATIFEEFRIDFCCKGKLLLSEACRSQNVDVDKIDKLLNEIRKKNRNGFDKCKKNKKYHKKSKICLFYTN